MVSLEFGGKSAVYAHHLTVPARSLVPDPAKSHKSADGDNLIIHGDNLHALKALLPRYAGRVDCIYIDPPYNTGNEGWAYNDNVNNPTMREWLEGAREVDGEDLERHDKWLCMMWPRLQLLKELLAEGGAIFVSIDDNEQHRLRLMMDEIFGADNFIANIIWQKKYSPQNDAKHLSDDHDFILVYAKDGEAWHPNLLPRTEKQDKAYSNPDDDPRGPWKSSGLDVKTYQQEYDYPITTPSGRVVKPPPGACWRYSRKRFDEMVADNRIWFGKKGDSVPSTKRFLSEVKQGITPRTVWLYGDVGHTQSGTQTLKGMGMSFPNPKPHTLIKQVLRIGADKNAIVLDSFAGSGTTAHAVLDMNRQDSGDRKFILVECEDYADRVTAERVRCVIRGVRGAKGKVLQEGTGGSFTYCTLGEPIDVELALTGKSLPPYGELASHLLYRATGVSAGRGLRRKNGAGLFHSAEATDYYLLYEPNPEYMRSSDAVLTEKRAKRIAKRNASRDRKAVVFAAEQYLGQKRLTDMDITFCRIPDEIGRA